MKANFILENFDQYVKEVYVPLNEKEDQGLSQIEARKIIDDLIAYQAKKAISIRRVTVLAEKIFGKDIVISMKKFPGRWAGPKQGAEINLSKAGDEQKNSAKEKKGDFFQKIVEFDSMLAEERKFDYKPAIIMGLFSQFMTQGSKNELEKALSKRATELNLTYKKIDKLIKKKIKDNDLAILGLPPSILGYVSEDEIEKVMITQPIPPKEIVLLDPLQQNTLFLDNSWTLNPEVGKTLRNNLFGILERRKQGSFTKITELSIASSASRYRNNKGKTGNAENLSWGQLAFKRAQVIHNMINEILEELQIPKEDPIRAELNKVATMNIKGSNGDGTSGPNPGPDPALGNLRIGYYQTTTKQTKVQTGISKFIDEDANSPEKVYIVEIDDLGNTISEPKVIDIPIQTNRKEYEQYKFVNVLVKVEETVFQPGKDGSIQIEKVPEGTLAPVVNLEKKFNERDTPFKFPKPPKLNISRWWVRIRMGAGGGGGCLVCTCGEF